MSVTHFLYWTLKLDPKPLNALIVHFLKNKSIWKCPIQDSICFKLVLGLLVLGPLSEVALSTPTYNGGINQGWKWWWDVLEIKFHAGNKNSQGSFFLFLLGFGRRGIVFCIFVCSQCIPIKFSKCSHQASKVFPKSPMYSLRHSQ